MKTTTMMRRMIMTMITIMMMITILPTMILIPLMTMVKGTSATTKSNNFDPQIDIVCWTCRSRRTNEECNLMSPLTSCPRDMRLCKNIHHFDHSLATINVTKMCASHLECTHLGCRGNFGDVATTVCSTCCDFSMCNELVATDPIMAFNLTYIRSMANSELFSLFLETVALLMATIEIFRHQ